MSLDEDYVADALQRGTCNAFGPDPTPVPAETCQYCQRTDCSAPDPTCPGRMLATCNRGRFHDRYVIGYDIAYARASHKTATTTDLFTQAHLQSRKGH